MHKILISIILAAFPLISVGQLSFEKAGERASRFFANKEWASASAVYTYMLDLRPADASIYGRAIVSAAEMADTTATMQLLNRAMKAAVPLDSVLSAVQDVSFEVGNGNFYERFLLRAAHTYPWMSRPIDSYLLRYYTFRRNGPRMVEYAQKMLRGVPYDTTFLSILADGYMTDGDLTQAARTWERILVLDPDNYSALLCLANYHNLSGRPDLADPYFRRAAAIRPTPYVATRLATK